MTPSEVCGTKFVAGIGAYERSDTIHQNRVSVVRNGSQYRAWVCMRQPFLLPAGLIGHVCENHWEKFDVDKAACKICSNIHVCSVRTCPSTQALDGIICNVTGLFLSQRLVDHYDFPSSTENAYQAPRAVSFVQESPVELADLDNITRLVTNILASKSTQLSIKTETDKLMSKMRSICVRKMRTYRLLKQVPNLCDIDAYLHSMLHGHRIPPQSVSSSIEDRRWCIKFASLAISRLISFMRSYCHNIPSCVKQSGIVIGMLYMMRSGVTIDSITVLPRISRLKHILPLEQHLPTFFNVRAKVVTEAENVIKYNMRGVAASSLALLAQTQGIVRSR